MRAINRNQLTFGQRMKLANMVQGHYAEKVTTDEEFAARAQEVLGFPVTSRNVLNMRHELGIPTHRTLKTAPAVSGDPALDQLLARLEAIEGKLDKLVRALG